MNKPRTITPLTIDPFEQFATELRSLRTDLDAVRSRLDTLPDRARSLARRQRLHAALVALIALLVCAGALYALRGVIALDAAHALGPVSEAPALVIDGGLTPH